MAKEASTKNKEESEHDKIVLKNCFIVTPIGEQNSEVNQKAFGLIKAVMQPVLEEFSYQPVAASDISSVGSINRQIIVKLYEDDLVIANLTGLNPNVMYELAVRHAVRKPVIIMAEKGTSLPFDLYDQRCIFYEDTLHGVEAARKNLRNFLKKILDEEVVTNPIYDSIKEQNVIKNLDSDEKPIQYILERFDRLEKRLSQQSSAISSGKTAANYVKAQDYIVSATDRDRVISIIAGIKLVQNEFLDYIIEDLQDDCLFTIKYESNFPIHALENLFKRRGIAFNKAP